MAFFIHYRKISYIVDLLSWNSIVGKIYYRDSPNINAMIVKCWFDSTAEVFIHICGKQQLEVNSLEWNTFCP